MWAGTEGSSHCLGRGWLGVLLFWVAKDREGMGRSLGCGPGVEGMSWGWREWDLHGHGGVELLPPLGHPPQHHFCPCAGSGSL